MTRLTEAEARARTDVLRWGTEEERSIVLAALKRAVDPQYEPDPQKRVEASIAVSDYYARRRIGSGDPNADGQRIDTGWVDLGPIARGELPPVKPGIIYRDDGAGLFYPGARHDVHGAPGHGKSWLVFFTGAETLGAGGSFAVLDYEGTPHVFVERLRALGVDDDTITDPARVSYHNFPGRTGKREVEALAAHFTDKDLIALDAMLPALVRNGLEDNSNTDIAKFYDTVITPLTSTGAAVVTADHLTKAKGVRGARGAGAKLQLADVSYEVQVIQPFSRTRPGWLKVRCEKDRHGTYVIGEIVAEAHFTPGEHGRLAIRLAHPSEPGGDGDSFEPTHLMEKVSRLLEKNPDGLSKTTIRKRVKGRAEYVDLAVDRLVERGHVARFEGTRNAVMHAILDPYREPDDPVPDSVPPVPGQGDHDPVPLSRPYGTGTGTGSLTPPPPLTTPSREVTP